MHITLDQAQAFEAVVRLGTIQKAAKSLHKGHSAILYSIRSLEEQSGLSLFDRGGYRNQISAQGQVVLKYCQQLLHTKTELEQACQNLRGGWEPNVSVVYDGVVDFNLIVNALLKVKRANFPTEIKITAAFLREVERKFLEEKADLMLTILPIHLPEFLHVSLRPIDLVLVVHRNHPLAKHSARSKAKVDDLRRHSFVKVRETLGQIGLSTETVGFNSSILVNDFPTKREALMRGLGFGWLPEYIIQRELENGELRVIHAAIENRTRLYPRLYHRKPELLGRAVSRLINAFQ